MTHDAWAVFAGLIGSAFMLARVSLWQQRALAERMIGVLELAIARQEIQLAALQGSVDDMRILLAENSTWMRRFADGFAETFSQEGEL